MVLLAKFGDIPNTMGMNGISFAVFKVLEKYILTNQQQIVFTETLGLVQEQFCIINYYINKIVIVLPSKASVSPLVKKDFLLLARTISRTFHSYQRENCK